MKYDDKVVGIGRNSGRIYYGLYRTKSTMLDLSRNRIVAVKNIRKLTKLDRALQ